MNDADKNLVFKITDEDIIGAYNEILEINSKPHAELTMGVLIDALKKCKSIYLKDRIHVLLNLITYKYHSFLDERCKDEELDEAFIIIKSFLNDFQTMLNEFGYLFNNNVYTPEDVADMYLYYFTLLTIHNRIIESFDSELERASIETLAFSVDLPMNRTIDDSVHDFNEILKLVRKFKQEKEDNH